MGGRGSLSPNKHKMYNTATIKAYMNSKGVAVHGLNKVSRKGLSVVVEALETLDTLQQKHGKRVENVLLGVNSGGDFSFSELKTVKVKGGKEVKLKNTLIIPIKTIEYGKASLEKEVKYANRNKIVVARNVKEMIYHEYGHALHHSLKVSNPSAYNELERRFATLMKKKDSRVDLSMYASTKQYTKRSQTVEYVAESVVHILRNTRTHKGADMVDLVRNYVSLVPNSNIKLGITRGTSAKKTSGRKRTKKK